MEQDFWAQRWSAGAIGFHEGRPNSYLVSHLEALLPAGGAAGRVLVPLCGKSHDLHWLAARCASVVGVEFVEQAVRDFFAEAGLSPTRVETPAGARYTVGNLTLFAADFFALDAAALDPQGEGPLAAFYDRAALIALPPPLRARYAAHLATLLPPGASGLSVSLTYPEGAHQGPPFSVEDSEFTALFGTRFAVEVRARDVSANGPGGIEVTNTVRGLVRRP